MTHNNGTPKDHADLPCPECDKVCKPLKVLNNGTVVYQAHECEANGGSDSYSFSIDINGELVED